MNPSRLGINTHWPTAAQLDRLVAAGIQRIRIDANMKDVEPSQHAWKWDILDEIVAQAVARGLHIYATLAHLPNWVEPGSIVPWVAFVEETALRYRGRIRHYGIDNEPNNRLTPGEYLEWMYRPAAGVLRTVDPTIKVCGPELMTEETKHGSWTKWLADFAGLLRDTPLDIVTVHSYQKNGREVLRHVVGPQTWAMWFKQQQPVREVLRRAGLGEKPLWLTEVGFNTAEVSEEQQASYYDQLLESLPSEGMLEKVFAYQAFDEPGVRWGIAHEDLTPKPAFHTIQRYLRPGVV